MGKISAQVLSLRKVSEPVKKKLELACPAHTLASLKTAIENGANSIYIEYRSTARQAHLRTSLDHDAALRKGIRLAHEHQVKIVLSLPRSPADADTWTASTAMISAASRLSVDAIALSDPALMLYTAAHHPNLAIHYMASQSTIEAGAIRLLKRNIPISRVILPRVVSVAQIEEISGIPGVDVELVGFGKGCSILAPRAPAAGDLPRTLSAALAGGSHAPFVPAAANHDAIETCGLPGEAMNDQLFHSAQPDECHALGFLPQLAAIDVRALRIELRDHSTARLAKLTRVWREAIDECLQDTRHYNVRAAWLSELKTLSSLT